MRRSQDALVKTGIHPRRYFYPSLSKLPLFQGRFLPVAEDIAERILCLPIWANMDEAIATRTSEDHSGAMWGWLVLFHLPRYFCTS